MLDRSGGVGLGECAGLEQNAKCESRDQLRYLIMEMSSLRKVRFEFE
jgi:hypothetical protein